MEFKNNTSPVWLQPSKTDNNNGINNIGGEKVKPLLVKNSLTSNKVEFIPKGHGKQVTWYGCGPTVYDASHMGHARSYITFDIIRRIMEDYFGYNVLYVMNITDIDDKIIVKGRYNYLITQYAEKNCTDLEAWRRDVLAALAFFMKKKKLYVAGDEVEEEQSSVELLLSACEKSVKQLPALETESASTNSEDLAKKIMNLKEVQKTLNALAKVKAGSMDLQTATNEYVKDVLAPWLDDKHGSEVTDPKVFRNLAAYYEKDFLADMQALNVLPCDVMTRVSEYVPEIIAFVQKIMDNGYAYEAGGSVYFDTLAFDSNPNHFYAKLRPNAKGNVKLAEEGEGSLTTGTGKKNACDFALWKKSKSGEPAWPSPWSQGRPGWHIECSVMASAVLGSNIDIHSGGIDLAFPHHDNEMAQSEAHFGCAQWINYFFHAGHLHIEGQKMSKSLKNFITIKEALATYSARQIRLMFLMQSWSEVLDYKKSTMEGAINFEKKLLDFFSKIKALVREHSQNNPFEGVSHAYGDEAKSLIDQLLKKEVEMHDALCDSFNTPACMRIIQEAVGTVYSYLELVTAGKIPLCSDVLIKYGRFISKFLRIFGLDDFASRSDYGLSSGSGNSSSVTQGKEETVMPFVNLISDFRHQIREVALKNPKEMSEILKLCDAFRDETCPQLGISLEDRSGGQKPLVMLFDDPSALQAARLEKLQLQANKEAKKAADAAAAAAKAEERERRARIPAHLLFKEDPEYEGQFSKYDESGIPTHDNEGAELTKSRRKKLEKIHASQVKSNEKISQ